MRGEREIGEGVFGGVVEGYVFVVFVSFFGVVG